VHRIWHRLHNLTTGPLTLSQLCQGTAISISAVGMTCLESTLIKDSGGETHGLGGGEAPQKYCLAPPWNILVKKQEMNCAKFSKF